MCAIVCDPVNYTSVLSLCNAIYHKVKWRGSVVAALYFSLLCCAYIIWSETARGTCLCSSGDSWENNRVLLPSTEGGQARERVGLHTFRRVLCIKWYLCARMSNTFVVFRVLRENRSPMAFAPPSEGHRSRPSTLPGNMQQRRSGMQRHTGSSGGLSHLHGIVLPVG